MKKFAMLAIVIGFCADHDCVLGVLNSLSVKQYQSAKVYGCDGGTPEDGPAPGYCVAYRVDGTRDYPIVQGYEEELHK